MITEQNEMLQQGNLDLRIERNALHTKLREANNQIAQLEFELESLKSDAGEEIHDMSVRYQARLTAAAALAEAVANHVADPQDPHTLLDLVKALREYREAK